MLPSFCNETITVQRAHEVEERGSTVKTWDNPDEHSISGCLVKVSSSTGDITDRDNSTETCSLVAPKCADIKQGDRVICLAGKFTVIGDPYQVNSPTGNISHTKATLQRWCG